MSSTEQGETAPAAEGIVNVAHRLTLMAAEMPEATAVFAAEANRPFDKPRYEQISFARLDLLTDRLAAGLQRMGVQRGTRLALLVRPGIEFIALTFAVFKAGAVGILIDPGMGSRNFLRCLDQAQPEGFLAITVAHAVRSVLRKRFSGAKFNVTVGRRWFWGGETYLGLAAQDQGDFSCAATQAEDLAAIIFTTGSTGPPKGVEYRHGNFNTQVDQIRERYQITPGQVDVACFPLFALFNCAMGATTVIPDMDASRPAAVDPRKIIRVVADTKADRAFGSPAVWDRVGRHCREFGAKLPTLKTVLSAGAPVPPRVLQGMKQCIAPTGEIFTPYGATEALPVASISASEVLGQTRARSDEGAGTCVGTRFSGIQWKVIRICEEPLPTLADAEELPLGEIGELIVSGPVVTRAYINPPEANARAKIADEAGGFWHRMGDVGYLDAEGRFWFCGRMAHRVITEHGTLYSVPCEAIVNRLPEVFRSALVGVGPAGSQRAVLLVEPEDKRILRNPERSRGLLEEVRQAAASSPLTREILVFGLHDGFPVDIRHNSKIFREKLAVWAGEQLPSCEDSWRWRVVSSIGPANNDTTANTTGDEGHNG